MKPKIKKLVILCFIVLISVVAAKSVHLYPFDLKEYIIVVFSGRYYLNENDSSTVDNFSDSQFILTMKYLDSSTIKQSTMNLYYDKNHKVNGIGPPDTNKSLKIPTDKFKDSYSIEVKIKIKSHDDNISNMSIIGSNNTVFFTIQKSFRSISVGGFTSNSTTIKVIKETSRYSVIRSVTGLNISVYYPSYQDRSPIE